MKKLIAWISQEDLSNFSLIASTGAKEALSQLPATHYSQGPSINDVIDLTLWDEVILFCPFKFPLDQEFKAHFGPLVTIQSLQNGKDKLEDSNIVQTTIKKIIGKQADDYFLFLADEDNLSPIFRILGSFDNSKINQFTCKANNIISRGSNSDALNIIIKPGYFRSVLGTARHLTGILRGVEQALGNDTPVLLTGEQGTGRKKIAQIIADSKNTASAITEIVTFPSIDCRMDEELFGTDNCDGALQKSNSGTLILDNIDHCNLKTQLELLKVLRNSQGDKYSFSPTNSNNTISSKFRIIATATQNLLELTKKQLFLEELYYLLSDIRIDLPPLRTRGIDIKILASSFLKEINEKNQDAAWKYLAPEAMDIIEAYAWPGNIRELQQVIRQAYMSSTGKIIQAEDLSIFAHCPIKTPLEKSKLFKPDFSLDKEVDRLKIFYIKNALELCGGKKTKASEMLGISNHQTLSNMLKKYNLNPNESMPIIVNTTKPQDTDAGTKPSKNSNRTKTGSRKTTKNKKTKGAS